MLRFLRFRQNIAFLYSFVITNTYFWTDAKLHFDSAGAADALLEQNASLPGHAH
jgi:hypothetical protein